MKDKISKIVKDQREEMIKMRRDFHRHAEPAWLEFRTASIIALKLSELGYNLQMGKEVVDEKSRMGVPPADVLEKEYKRAEEQGADPEFLPNFKGGFTGLTATLETGKPGPVIGLRFDIDSNDLTEPEGKDHIPTQEGFASINEGAMHACGHDAHAAIGLGVAAVLAQLKDELSGKVKFIFQPAEEGVRGAKSMVAAGVTDDLDLLLAMHIGFGVEELGVFACGNEQFLATTKYDVTYKGVPAHAGSSPDEGKNALLAAALAVTGLYGIARHKDGSSRINVGVLKSGSGRNIIPDFAEMKLEIRGQTTEINDYMVQKALSVLKGAAQMQEVEYETEEVGGAPASVSSSELVSTLEKITADHPGVKKFLTESPFAGSEDVTYMMQAMDKRNKPSAYLVAGTPLKSGHHKRDFDFDEEVIPLAADVISNAVLHLSGNYKQEVSK